VLCPSIRNHESGVNVILQMLFILKHFLEKYLKATYNYRNSDASIKKRASICLSHNRKLKNNVRAVPHLRIASLWYSSKTFPTFAKARDKYSLAF
jgi:hypothetical protein